MISTGIVEGFLESYHGDSPAASVADAITAWRDGYANVAIRPVAPRRPWPTFSSSRRV
jgi:hypothetical protein